MQFTTWPTLLNIALSTGASLPVRASNLLGILNSHSDVAFVVSSNPGQSQHQPIGSSRINLHDSTVRRDEMTFKRIFDSRSDRVPYKRRFLDLVYYSKGFNGTGRENIESDINEWQSQQFDLRNDGWIAWESFFDRAPSLQMTLTTIVSRTLHLQHRP